MSDPLMHYPLSIRNGRLFIEDCDTVELAEKRRVSLTLAQTIRRQSDGELLVRGRASDVVTEQEVAEFLQLIPHASYVDVDKARHMVAGDRNDIFTAAVIDFLTQLKEKR